LFDRLSSSKLAGRSTTKDELDDMLETGNTAIFTEGIVTDTKQAIESLREIEERHKDIIKLESSIRELHEMFIEMGALVAHQGDLVDVIQTQVEKTKDFVMNANGQIAEALVNKSKAARVSAYLHFFQFFYFKTKN
jgi:syntaxin 1A